MKQLIAVCILSTTAFWGCAAAQDTLAGQKNAPKINVTVTNPTSLVRTAETISMDWATVRKSIPTLTADTVGVYDIDGKRYLMTQVTKAATAPQLLFQTDLAPNQIKNFYVMIQPDVLNKPSSSSRTYCRFIPERYDDFGWENDKAAYRMYGPALEWQTITSGLDAWGKCVPYPVIDGWIWNYKNRKIPYHENHGEGGDFFNVGTTLGCGGMAPFVDGKVCLPRNFVNWKILDNGPIRSTFELSYNPWKAGSNSVSEVKHISIDLGSNMNRFECTYKSDDTDTLSVAAGIVLRDTSDQIWADDNAVAYWLPTDGHDYGMMGCGIVFDRGDKTERVKADGHLLLCLKQNIGTPVVYYAGSCWNKNEEFSSFEKWQAYLKNFQARLKTPVTVTMTDVK